MPEPIMTISADLADGIFIGIGLPFICSLSGYLPALDCKDR